MMARHALKHSQRPELKAMAEKVIKDQQKEIEQMKQWRMAWYGELCHPGKRSGSLILSEKSCAKS